MGGVLVGALAAALWLLSAPIRAEVIIAEGERFTPLDAAGWKLTRQDDTYASHTFGGMWLTHGACLGAPAESAGSVAAQKVTVREGGRFRVWSKYQAPPYFNYLHWIAVVQGGRTVFAHEYGRSGTPRLWSFGAAGSEAWWPWGVDHDAAEAPQETAVLSSGPAEILLITEPNAAPAGDRYVDFVVLTTSMTGDYIGYKPYAVSTPFAGEALAATRLFLRFKNTADIPAQLLIKRPIGHFGPDYRPAEDILPQVPVPAGQWSPWVNIGPFLRLVSDDGLAVTVQGAKEVRLEFSREPASGDDAGKVRVPNGESVSIPKEIVWNKEARVRSDAERAEEIVRLSRRWRSGNGGKKPKDVLFYGEFQGTEEWLLSLKDALGYNTLLPDRYQHVKRDGIAYWIGDAKKIENLAASLKDKDAFRVMSFGDEIGLGDVDYADPKTTAAYRVWLTNRGVTTSELGEDPAAAVPAKDGAGRRVWYSSLFSQDAAFESFRQNTALAKRLIGPHVLAGANYSPHTPVLFYGPLFQWIDAFKQDAMGLFWTEDYIHIVPEVPQIISWMLAEARCAVKYHEQPLHFYILPHAPGQQPGFLRRNILAAVGFGASHIDNFWIAPMGRFSENYVSWDYRDTFRTLHEAIYDTAEAEKLQAGGRVRPARIAVVLSKATEFNETRGVFEKSKDPFAVRTNAPEKLEQTLGRKEQQMLYLALRQAQHAADLVTEDDVKDGALKDYDVAYFAGEWIDKDAVPPLADWVRKGGMLYADGGLGLLNQFDEPEGAMLDLLGLSEAAVEKNAVNLRTVLELPLADPIGTIALGRDKIAAIGLKQKLVPETAKALANWEDGSVAATVNEFGRGKAFAVGTLAGMSWMKTGLPAEPFARAGNKRKNPVDFAPAAARLTQLGADAKAVARAVVCSKTGVEAAVIDHKDGTLVTLLNWTNAPLKDLEVTVRMKQSARDVRSVRLQKSLPHEFKVFSGFKDLEAVFRLDLDDADYILLPK